MTNSGDYEEFGRRMHENFPGIACSGPDPSVAFLL